MGGARRHGGVWILALFCMYLLAILDHTMQNLLTYDECEWPGDQGNAIEIQEDGEEEPEAEKLPQWRIVINLDLFKVYVYKCDTLVHSYPCSGGKAATPSPTGDFKIVAKDAWGEGFGGAWMGLNVPWGKYGIHGTKFPWIIGKKHCSKGCIRMLSRDAQELVKLVPYGTPVRIIQEKRPFRLLKSGDIGPDVRDVQGALQQLGYYYGNADGRFGQRLFAAVTDFQKDNGLPVTGKIDKKTYDLIEKILGQVQNTSV